MRMTKIEDNKRLQRYAKPAVELIKIDETYGILFDNSLGTYQPFSKESWFDDEIVDDSEKEHYYWE